MKVCTFFSVLVSKKNTGWRMWECRMCLRYAVPVLTNSYSLYRGCGGPERQPAEGQHHRMCAEARPNGETTECSCMRSIGYDVVWWKNMRRLGRVMRSSRVDLYEHERGMDMMRMRNLWLFQTGLKTGNQVRVSEIYHIPQSCQGKKQSPVSPRTQRTRKWIQNFFFCERVHPLDDFPPSLPAQNRCGR